MPQAEQRAHRLRHVPLLRYAMRNQADCERKEKVHRRTCFFHLTRFHSIEPMSDKSELGTNGASPAAIAALPLAPARSHHGKPLSVGPFFSVPLCLCGPFHGRFYSTMNPSRNPYISLKINDRCTFYSTMNPGVPDQPKCSVSVSKSLKIKEQRVENSKRLSVTRPHAAHCKIHWSSNSLQSIGIYAA